MTVSVIVPTVSGREDSYQRAVDSFAGCEVVTVRDAATCGYAWVQGARKATGDYLCLAADDWQAHPGFTDAMTEAVDDGYHPASTVLTASGALQSCGGVGWDTCRQDCPDWAPTDWSPTPVLSRDQWELIEPHALALSDLHYCSDVLVSRILACHGIATVVRRPAVITHFDHPVGRGAGMTQTDRSLRDRSACNSYMATL